MPLLVCPNCNVGMTNVQRSGVEIDMCPQCRGVWLDRGELEKLLQPLREEARPPSGSFLPPGLEASHPASVWGQAPAVSNSGYWNQHEDHDRHRDESGHHGHQDRHQKSGRRSLLDFFD